MLNERDKGVHYSFEAGRRTHFPLNCTFRDRGNLLFAGQAAVERLTFDEIYDVKKDFRCGKDTAKT